MKNIIIVLCLMFGASSAFAGVSVFQKEQTDRVAQCGSKVYSAREANDLFAGVQSCDRGKYFKCQDGKSHYYCGSGSQYKANKLTPCGNKDNLPIEPQPMHIPSSQNLAYLKKIKASDLCKKDEKMTFSQDGQILCAQGKEIKSTENKIKDWYKFSCDSQNAYHFLNSADHQFVCTNGSSPFLHNVFVTAGGKKPRLDASFKVQQPAESAQNMVDIEGIFKCIK